MAVEKRNTSGVERYNWVLFLNFLDYVSLFFNSTYPVIYIAKEIFWVEIYRGRLFLRAEIYRGRLFVRADRYLGAKQDSLTMVHFLNKLIVSCKEAVRFPFYFFAILKLDSYFFIQIKMLFPVHHTDCPFYAEV